MRGLPFGLRERTEFELLSKRVGIGDLEVVIVRSLTWVLVRMGEGK